MFIIQSFVFNFRSQFRMDLQSRGSVASLLKLVKRLISQLNGDPWSWFFETCYCIFTTATARSLMHHFLFFLLIWLNFDITTCSLVMEEVSKLIPFTDIYHCNVVSLLLKNIFATTNRIGKDKWPVSRNNSHVEITWYVPGGSPLGKKSS